MLPAVEEQSLNHWTTGEVPWRDFLKKWYPQSVTGKNGHTG